MRRVLARVDPDALDQVVGAWLARQQPPVPTTRPPPAPRRPRRAVAVDGKTLRGSGHHPRLPVHLLAAMDHTSRAVLAQTGVDGKTNEITRFRPLLDRLDLADTVVTADALHTQREHAEWLVTHKHAAYLLIVKANQPALQRQLKLLPWREVPQTHTYTTPDDDVAVGAGHGRQRQQHPPASPQGAGLLLRRPHDEQNYGRRTIEPALPGRARIRAQSKKTNLRLRRIQNFNTRNWHTPRLGAHSPAGETVATTDPMTSTEERWLTSGVCGIGALVGLCHVSSDLPHATTNVG